jgi:hypothetical protein
MEVAGSRLWWRSWVSTANCEEVRVDVKIGGVKRQGAHMVAGEGLALEHDLVFPVDVGLVKGRHEQVEVGRQRLHHGDFRLGGAHDRGDELGGLLVGVEPGRERGLIEGLEVPLDALGRPCREILADTGLGPLGLEAQGVPAEVDALVRGINTRCGFCSSVRYTVISRRVTR